MKPIFCEKVEKDNIHRLVQNLYGYTPACIAISANKTQKTSISVRNDSK